MNLYFTVFYFIYFKFHDKSNIHIYIIEWEMSGRQYVYSNSKSIYFIELDVGTKSIIIIYDFYTMYFDEMDMFIWF